MQPVPERQRSSMSILLDVLDRIAAAGDDGSNGPGDGRPNLQVTITSVA